MGHFYVPFYPFSGSFLHADLQASAICKDVDVQLFEKSKRYCEHLLKRALQESHGAIVAVIDRAESFEMPDAVILEEQIPITNIVELSHSDPIYLPELSATEEFIIGAFGCDGIVLFDTGFNFIGYNGFIESSTPITQQGGARRRAFDSLCKLLGQGLVATFMQSQDGYTYYQPAICQG